MRQNISHFWGLNRFERCLWGVSVFVMLAGYCIAPAGGLLNLFASLIGVTALIFVSKGYVVGQALTVLFALFYGVISYEQRYYGEMITYLCMTAPIALLSVVSWLKHPYEGSKEVEVGTLNNKQRLLLTVATVATTVLFYFILKELGTANLFFSTLSVSTSFVASSLTFFRSSAYALGYAANDIMLIILWLMASVNDPSCLVMAACFLMFLANDLYGYFNWRKMKRRQTSL